MSLLPGQIIPYDTPIGTVSADGDVQINHDWWLLFYNICQQLLASGSSFPTIPIVESLAIEIDANAADPAALRRPIENLFQSIPVDPDPVPYSAIGNALVAAQDGLLTDPVPLAQPIGNISLGASPAAYTASTAGTVYVSGGTVTGITLTRQGTTITYAATSGNFPVCRADVLTITYTSIPIAQFIPWSSQ